LGWQIVCWGDTELEVALVGRRYYVYIMTNRTRTLYTGVTHNLTKRVDQHKNKLLAGFTTQYNLTRLAYFEVFDDIRNAIAREKQIKGWLRSKKVALIIAGNPTWKDLAEDWYGPTPGSGSSALSVVASKPPSSLSS
jgi:putative endonuclease